MQILSIIIISQVISAILVLFFQKKNRYSNKILIGILVVFGFWMTNILLRVSGTFKVHPNLYFIPINFSLSFGPLIFFYIKSLTNKDYRLEFKAYKHFIPLIIQFVFYAVCFLLPYSMKRSFWINVHSTYTYDFEIILVQLSLIIYLILSIRYFRNYKTYIANTFSETSKISLRWLRVVIILFLALAILWMVDFLAWIILGITNLYSLLEILIAIMALVLALGGILQSNLTDMAYTGKESEQPKKSDMSLDKNTTQKILSYMENNQLYLNPTLSLDEFSKAVGLPKRTVSNHINHDIKSTFTDFVNQYRINKVIECLKSKDHANLTILGIALSCGFNSKTTFNRTFKKIKGVSPREYLNNISIE